MGTPIYVLCSVVWWVNQSGCSDMSFKQTKLIRDTEGLDTASVLIILAEGPWVQENFSPTLNACRLYYSESCIGLACSEFDAFVGPRGLPNWLSCKGRLD